MTDTYKTTKIAFIKARWHADIVDRAYDGFVAAAAQMMPGATVEAFDVDGGIYRHDFVAAAVVDGLMAAQLATGVPVFSVSLTPHNYQPVDVLTDFFRAHFVKKGEEAANAVRQVLELDQRLAALK
jgi:6,7-dimethyl-8-ribityllumazine synthase